MAPIPDRDPYEAVLTLVETVRDEMRTGLADIKNVLRDTKQDRDNHCKTHTDRLDRLESTMSDRLKIVEEWKTSLSGAYGALSILAGAVAAFVSLVVTWLAGRHH